MQFLKLKTKKNCLPEPLGYYTEKYPISQIKQ